MERRRIDVKHAGLTMGRRRIDVKHAGLTRGGG